MSVEARVIMGLEISMAAANDGGQPIRILVADDDAVILDKIITHLEEHGIRGVAVSAPDDALRAFAECEPDFVIIALHRGQFDGFGLLRAIRSRSSVPVIITTSERQGEIDRVVGLELGADDCMTKPIGLRELLARIRSILRRRCTGRELPQRDSARGSYRFGSFLLDRRTRRLMNPAGVPVILTKNEYSLLIAFLEAPQRALSREHLLQATRVHEDVLDRTIDVQVLRLRRKLEADPDAPRVIVTNRGMGYMFGLAVERLDQPDYRGSRYRSS